MKEKRGFTIIELIVVLAIAALLLSFVFVVVKDAKARNRDARREEDMRQIQNAMNLFVTNTRRFPICATETVIDGANDCLSQVLILAGAISGVPTDPLGRASGSCQGNTSFVYCYESADGLSYILRYHLETDTIPQKSAGWHEVSP